MDTPNFGKSILGFTAAEGGIIQGHFIPLKAFATGGVVDRPTFGLVGEGRYPEAIVPLPDGRNIPVKFTGLPQSFKSIHGNSVTEKLLKAEVRLPSGLSIPVKFENLPPIFKEYKEQLSHLAFVLSLIEKEKVLNNQEGLELKAFAAGGIVDRPTLGLVGEAGKEAVVPLPDNRSIPVKFIGKQNQPISFEIVIVDDRNKIPPPQIGKEQIILTVAENIRNNGIIRKLIQLA